MEKEKNGERESEIEDERDDGRRTLRAYSTR